MALAASSMHGMQAAAGISFAARTCLCLCALLLSACTLPTLVERPESFAISELEAAATPLGQALAPRLAQAPAGTSGVRALRQGREAFAARVLLTRAAARSLDVQYYIWDDDISGYLMLRELLEAAGRGVRVRLLLDDHGIDGLDDELAALDSHPLIEVRIFNPYLPRSRKWLNYFLLHDFGRVNRRMHNKSFTADNRVTIVGGRNIGDEYFGTPDPAEMIDLDVLAVGPVVGAVSMDFDRYWESGSAYPAARLLAPAAPDALARLAENAGALAASPGAEPYLEAVRASPFLRELRGGALVLEWAPVRVVSDDPAKGLGRVGEEGLITFQLREILGMPQRSVDLVSPYFVPGRNGVEDFVAMAARGVRVRILTNSLDATDVAVVHAGYAKRRRPLLEAGITLYEMRAVGNGGPPEPDVPPGAEDEENGDDGVLGPFGSSATSLHAKTFGVDGERVFVGSFNFDPRSANFNTELGFVIDSPALARDIEAVFDQGIAEVSYEVRLDADGHIVWLERRGGDVIRHDSEPRSSLLRRAIISVLSLLPIDWML